MALKKILCCCMSGLGSSFIVEMNVKSVLQEKGMGDVEVVHSGVNDVAPGVADLFVCSADLAESCLAVGDTIPLENLMSKEEFAGKLEAYLAGKA